MARKVLHPYWISTFVDCQRRLVEVCSASILDFYFCRSLVNICSLYVMHPYWISTFVDRITRPRYLDVLHPYWISTFVDRKSLDDCGGVLHPYWISTFVNMFRMGGDGRATSPG